MATMDYIQDLNRSVFDTANQQDYTKNIVKGLSEELIRRISSEKKRARMDALASFKRA